MKVHEERTSSERAAPLKTALRRDRWIVISCLAVLTLLAWVYLISLTGGKGISSPARATSGIVLPRIVGWSMREFMMVFVMWMVMMTAMMIPTSSNMVLAFASLRRKQKNQRSPLGDTALFVLGYLVVWGGFSFLLTVIQGFLFNTALLSGMMGRAVPLIGGLILAVAGLFQFTELKYACLRKCRRPMGFLLTEWRDGLTGAFSMGVRHGWFCSLCCWALMLLMFVLGVMNILWMLVLTLFILGEKVAPAGRFVSRVSGVVLLLWGTGLIVRNLIF